MPDPGSDSSRELGEIMASALPEARPHRTEFTAQSFAAHSSGAATKSSDTPDNPFRVQAENPTGMVTVRRIMAVASFLGLLALGLYISSKKDLMELASASIVGAPLLVFGSSVSCPPKLVKIACGIYPVAWIGVLAFIDNSSAGFGQNLQGWLDTNSLGWPCLTALSFMTTGFLGLVMAWLYARDRDRNQNIDREVRSTEQ